ncbi:hypothetical protein C5E14_14225, partial [Rathayibacter sp. AY1A1]
MLLADGERLLPPRGIAAEHAGEVENGHQQVGGGVVRGCVVGGEAADVVAGGVGLGGSDTADWRGTTDRRGITDRRGTAGERGTTDSRAPTPR